MGDKNLIIAIEDKRHILNKMVSNEVALTKDMIVHVSQELDKLIKEYYTKYN
ncbi:aspartyl-phosphate phosphatase Spo0E family protein [Irregularibacter muris]|uniref:Aspartyl-phosphate phosphatase Spo0E family protein n=1 Tax=Irregularibacter muris TaxID=1796619 RepID=A0AAE3L1X1_9FIRM|nr:aspartyl-phosphate phosphatase Spo0E family protein [Irregularibacter muris]MCR1897629.1 aspartyl-phosphate phosphatase Spo0E family protein [Irregularibacter muris]